MTISSPALRSELLAKLATKDRRAEAFRAALFGTVEGGQLYKVALLGLLDRSFENAPGDFRVFVANSDTIRQACRTSATVADAILEDFARRKVIEPCGPNGEALLIWQRALT